MVTTINRLEHIGGKLSYKIVNIRIKIAWHQEKINLDILELGGY